MQPSTLMGEILGAIAGRAGHSAGGDAKGWIVTLTSLLVLLAVGGAAARVSDRLMRRSTPELIVLLNQSAAFYRRWPEDQHVIAPPEELRAEANRCQRIVVLLERRAVAGIDRGPASRGPIDGLNAWIALLHSQLQARDSAASGPAYV